MDAEQLNPVINSRYFKPQKEWGWQVALDLYLAGIGSGALAIGLLMDWLGYSPYYVRAILLWGPISIAVGALFLVLKLGVKQRFWRTVMNPRTSWLSRGFFILSGCIILGMALLGISLLPLLGVNIGSWSSAIRVLDVIVFIFALAATIYTGILVKSIRYVSFWNTALMPALFTVSSFTTGIIATLLVTNIYDRLVFNEGYSSYMQLVLMNTAQVFVLIEAIILILYLYTRYRGGEGQARNSVRLLLSGNLRFVFWLGIVASGFVIPAILGIIYFRFPDHWYLFFTAGVLLLLSRFSLRAGFIYAGIKDQTPLHKLIEVQYYLKALKKGGIPDNLLEMFKQGSF